MAKDARYQSLIAGIQQNAKSRLLRSKGECESCIFRGKTLTLDEGELHNETLLQLGVKLNTCNGKRKEFHCHKHRFANLSKCMTCPDWRDDPHTQIPDVVKRAMRHHEKPSAPDGISRKPIRFDERNLAPETGGVRLNCSIATFKDGYAFAYRNRWGGAQESVIRLDKNFQPIGKPVQLQLKHNAARAGREDGRLFWHKGKLHIWWIGWQGHRSRSWNKANVLFSRLSDDFEVEDTFYPNIPNRLSMEKNHSYFDYNDETYCVYSIAPHRVHRVFCQDVIDTHETTTRHHFSHGHLRGGASPVLHNGEYYHFFHGMKEERGGRVYSMGVYTFEAKPPFRVTRMAHKPLDVATSAEVNGNYKVIFPGGAVFVNGSWAVAMGVADKWSEIRFYPASVVEAALKSV